MTREEMEAALAAMSQPSKVYLWLVNNTELYRGQLAALVPGRFFIPSEDDTLSLMNVYVHEDAVPLAMMIVADDDIHDWVPPKALSFRDEHTCRKGFGPWPWEAA